MPDPHGALATRPSHLLVVELTPQVGLRGNLLRLLSCYNPLWLRLAVEAITGETAPVGSSYADAGALRRFLDRRVLVAPVVVPTGEEGAHPGETAKRHAAFASAAQHKVIVRRVLALIVLLDAAKRSKLLRSDPCLFLPNITVKSSRDMAQEFCKLAISGGVGDINKHLGTLGIFLLHKQTALNEYNFSVASLATDMRDGVRLCRLVDLTMPPTNKAELSLVSQTRVPAGSRLQKLHNVELALTRMMRSGALPAVHDAKSQELHKRQVKLIVDGHCETTGEVMWNLLAHEVMPRLAPVEAVAREVDRARRAARRSTRGLPLAPAKASGA